MAMPELKSCVIRPSSLGEGDVALWRSFLQSSPAFAAPFLSHAYAVTAERCFGGVHVAKFEQGGQTAGFFPFQYRSPFHRLAGIGEAVSGYLADYFGLIAAPDFRISDGELLRAAGLNAIYFTHLEETQAAFGLSGTQPELGVRIDFPDGGKAFWDERRKLDKKFTGDTERRERRLIETHGPLRFVFRHADCRGELQKLIEAKRAQYARTGVKDSMGEASTRRFLEMLCEVSDPDCRATLSTLHAGDRWIGSHFGLMHGTTLHYWFPVYNPQMRNFGPGRLLIKAIIDASTENGVTRIDRGAGDSQAKLDFETSRHQFLRGIWSRPGFASLGYRAALSMQWRLQTLRKKAAAESPA
jgi:CelD/BcsL family acetyltransferase involved in cellulose biosynthesis